MQLYQMNLLENEDSLSSSKGFSEIDIGEIGVLTWAEVEEKIQLILFFHSPLEEGEQDYMLLIKNFRGSCPCISTLTTVDVQCSGGDVAYIHIANAEIHQHVCVVVTFGLPRKWKKGERT